MNKPKPHKAKRAVKKRNKPSPVEVKDFEELVSRILRASPPKRK
ncbi:MAG: hypothetical protein ACKVRP_11320 [Bacteroidota bacterium]